MERRYACNYLCMFETLEVAELQAKAKIGWHLLTTDILSHEILMFFSIFGHHLNEPTDVKVKYFNWRRTK
jgi:hypothetical protein